MKYLAIITFLIASGCSTKANVYNTWVNKNIHSKNLAGVLVVAVTENEELRILFEDDYLIELKKNGVNAHASHKLGLKQINPDSVVALAKEQNLNSVLIANYIGTDEYDLYHPDTYYFGGAMTISSEGGSHSYYGYSYQVDGPASYYTNNKYISLASSLYEVSTREMLWNTVSSAQQAGEPVNLFVPFMKSFIDQAKKDNLIK